MVYTWLRHFAEREKGATKEAVAPLPDRNQGETRHISSHHTMRRNVHQLLGQKIDFRYPQAPIGE